MLLAAGCGKKGPPLPPLQRIPAAASDLTAQRLDDTVFVSFTVPIANVDGAQPADVAGMEVYAITLAEPPRPDAHVEEEFRAAATLIATEQVRRPLPPMPEPPPGTPAPPPLPEMPGVDQGARITIREALTDAIRQPVAPPVIEEEKATAPVEETVPVLAGPAVMPPGGGAPARYYFVVPVTARGRYGPVSPLYPIPLETTSSAPSAPQVTYDETSVSLAWTPPRDARTSMMEPASGDVLPARPVVAGGTATRYNVFLVPAADAPPPAVPPSTAAPSPLNAEPLAEPSFTEQAVTFGIERCFVIRPVDVVGGTPVDGPASPPGCVTPKDTFPPPAPGSLAAVAAPGAISLIWDASDAADLAGYIVLRGDAAGATLQPLTPDPITDTTFRDERVTPGTRYVYAVIAVDKAGNPSGQSNRVEETARQ